MATTEQKAQLYDEICEALESRGWAHAANAKSIGDLANTADTALDLLDACQAVKDKLEYLCNLWGAEGVTRSLIQKLDNALAKATGEQVAS